MTQRTPETGDLVEMDVAVALVAAQKARSLIEDNANRGVSVHEMNAADAATLREVYAHLLTVTSSLAGATAVLEQRRSLLAILETAPTERPAVLRLVK